jgi:predicted tellurium resistance membrane protein TerC
VVTDAAPSASSELRTRQIRYGITMAFRTACFLAMIWVPGPARWVLLAAAAILPYIAVVAASQADRRSPKSPVEPESPRPAITAGSRPQGRE